MWTISSLARIFPYATSIEIFVATASATSFLSSAVMYLWGQLPYIRRYCPCGHFVHVEQILPHYSLLTFFAKIATEFDEFTKCLYLICRHFWKQPVQTSCYLGTKRREKTKKTRTLHRRITGNTKKRTAHVRLKMSRAYV